MHYLQHEVIVAIFKNLPCLRHLDLKGCRAIDKDEYRSLEEKCREITNEATNMGAQPRLHYLNLYGLAEYTVSACVAFIVCEHSG